MSDFTFSLDRILIILIISTQMYIILCKYIFDYKNKSSYKCKHNNIVYITNIYVI